MTDVRFGRQIELCLSPRSSEGLAACSCHSHGGFLTRRGYEIARSRGVDKTEAIVYIDRVSSVSGPVEVEEDFMYDPEHTILNRMIDPSGGFSA